MLSPNPAENRCRIHTLDCLDLRFPFWRYYEAVRNEPYSFLLDSAKDSERLGKYSFLGSQPSLIFRAKRQYGKAPAAGALIELIELGSGPGSGNGRVTHSVGDPFTCLRGLLEQYRVDASEYASRPVPCLAGAFGYFGYEAGYFIESLPDLGTDDLAMPDMYFLFSDVLLAHCHETGRSYLSVIGRGNSQHAARAAAGELREQWLRRIEVFEAAPPCDTAEALPANRHHPGVSLNAHFDRDSYAEAVRQVKEEILAGNAYEVCLTHRLDAPFPGDPWSLYCELRRINPAPFAAYLNFPEAQVVSSSPERFLSLGLDRIAESRPIKGTRPRGQTPEQDEKLYRELFSSVKDRAENVMIVDLVRNDFGRMSRFGSVVVPELMTVEKYATVFQMVSTIRGELDAGFDGLDLVRACFPGGSMTGAPKIEAMKIIDRLEPVKRGIYSGAIGYLDFAGNLDLNIVIRTIVVKDGRAYFNVGGAIVADSDPLGEYTETMDKARALISALHNTAVETAAPLTNQR